MARNLGRAFDVALSAGGLDCGGACKSEKYSTEELVRVLDVLTADAVGRFDPYPGRADGVRRVPNPDPGELTRCRIRCELVPTIAARLPSPPGRSGRRWSGDLRGRVRAAEPAAPTWARVVPARASCPSARDLHPHRRSAAHVRRARSGLRTAVLPVPEPEALAGVPRVLRQLRARFPTGPLFVICDNFSPHLNTRSPPGASPTGLSWCSPRPTPPGRTGSRPSSPRCATSPSTAATTRHTPRKRLRSPATSAGPTSAPARRDASPSAPRSADSITYPVGFQNPGMVPEQRLQAAVSYSLRRPPRTDRRRSTPTRPAVRSSRCTGWRASCTARLSIRAAEQPSAGQPVHISWTEFAPAQFD